MAAESHLEGFREQLTHQHFSARREFPCELLLLSPQGKVPQGRGSEKEKVFDSNGSPLQRKNQMESLCSMRLACMIQIQDVDPPKLVLVRLECDICAFEEQTESICLGGFYLSFSPFAGALRRCSSSHAKFSLHQGDDSSLEILINFLQLSSSPASSPLHVCHLTHRRNLILRSSTRKGIVNRTSLKSFQSAGHFQQVSELFRSEGLTPSSPDYASLAEVCFRDESFIKSEDEFSLSEGVDSLLSKALPTSHFNFENVRFTPKIIEFVDAFEGKQFAVKITIQNIGRNPVWVKVGEPNSFIFQLKKPSRRAKFLAAGACITKTITYTYHNVDLIQKSQIPVQINGSLVDYPIVVRKAVPDIEVQPQKLDFKFINLGASAKALTLTIFNKGGKRTKFKVDVGKNILDLVVSPMGGTIKAKSKVNVRVEMLGLNEGEYYQELWIKTNELAIRVPVQVKVVRPRLEIIFPNGTEDFTLITFPPTFNGTQRIQPFVLKNCSTDTTLFSTLAEVNGELQIMADAKKVDPFNMFLITAEEGRLEPFENRVCSVLFRPKAIVTKHNWHHKEEEKRKYLWDHIVFLRINRVQRIERREIAKAEFGAVQHKVKIKNVSASTTHIKSRQTLQWASQREEQSAVRRNYFTDSSLEEEKVLRLCLHGNAVAPDFLIQPLCLEFGDVYLGETTNKVLRVTNNTVIPAKCRLCKIVNVRATPTESCLKSEQAYEFCISLTPKSAGRFKSKMIVQILAHSDIIFDTDKAMEVVAEYTVVLNFNAKDISKIPGPKIGLGITPLITDDVGLQKDLITFKNIDKIPFAAALKLKQGFRTAWMKKEVDKLNNVDNALVALPNDRPRQFYTWPKEKICRTIFSGFFRYAPPEDVSYTLSAKERNQRKEHLGIWTNYLTFLRELRKAKCPHLDELKICPEYDISCKKHYVMKQIKLAPETHSTADSPKTLKKCTKESKGLIHYAYIPLSPTLLSKVTIEPKFINFNQVAVNSVAQKKISIINMNDFSISIKFVSGKSAVSIMESDTIIVQPSATKHILVLFQTKDLGRYFGFLNYVINGSHEFKITISALVMPKTVSMGDSPVSIHFGMSDPKEAFQPRTVFLPMKNLLQSPIKYRWEPSPDSAFSINVTDGEIPPRSTLFAEIKFDMCPRKSFYSEMTLLSESGNMETIKLVHLSKKVAVNFLSNKIDMHDIPLNLPTKFKAVIQNACYHEVPFEVVDANPLPGITIEPKEGLLKARSLFPLEINVQIPVIMKFSFHIVVMVHFINKISVKVTGNVVPPDVRVKPSEVVMRKICAHAIDTFAISVENVGTTPAEVFVDFKNCPEYRVADNNYKLYLLPSQTSRFLIQFEPTDVSRYMFYLPVTLNGILGPPEMQEPDTEYVCFYIGQYESLYEAHGDVLCSESSGLKIPCVCLNSTVTPSLLSITPLTVNFHLQHESYSQFQPENIVFTNESIDDITFCVRNDDLGERNDSPFDLVPIITDSVEERRKSMKVHLRKDEKLVMKATFEPTKPGSYSIDVPVFVRGYSKGLVYNFLHLKGELKSPAIASEASEIHFPPLPLDVDCDAIVMICAENYSTAETLNCLVYDPQEENGEGLSQYIKTKWLTEPKVSPCQKASSFQLQINFNSCIPVAVKNYILLFDSMGTYSSIFVTAIADNSVLTAHAFLTTRSTKYRIIRDKPPQFSERPEILSFPITKSELQIIERNLKEKKTIDSYPENLGPADSLGTLQIDKGPKLIVQDTKSTSRSTQLGFVNVPRRLLDCKTSSSTFLYVTKSKIVHSFISKPESISGSKIFPNPSLVKRTEMINDVSYPNFPIQESPYKTHFEETLHYVERWLFEVVMRCDRYFSIPLSFQRLIESAQPSKHSRKDKVPEPQAEKDFLGLLREIVGPDPAIPEWKVSAEDNYPETRAAKLQSVYAEILEFLENKGCLLPHVRPEFLMEYENYVLYMNEIKNVEVFSWKGTEVEKMNSMKILQDMPPVKAKPEREGVPRGSSSIFSPAESWKKSLFEGFMSESEDEIERVDERDTDAKEPLKDELKPFRDLLKGKQLWGEKETLDKLNFNLRSTQAWLDIVIQIFRVFVMKKIVPQNTIPQVSVVGINDKIPVESTSVYHDVNSCYGRDDGAQPMLFEDAHASNIYTLQERILMEWLNYHCQIQQRILWGHKSTSESPPTKKIINNFDKDLSDSVALISVTASHCPYIVPEYFDDVFQKPDNPTKWYHNAGKLIQAWRVLEIGLTVETSDIVQPNPVFMVMLVARLYEVLPSLHPHSLICFSAPLTTGTTRVIQLKNDLNERIFYKAKFFGEHEGLFYLKNSNLIDLKPFKTIEVRVTFTARKIKRISATLILIGSCISPHFGKHFAFYLEGEPSELLECDKFSFTAPLHKVICTSVPVMPPFTTPATYEVWYTTKKPEYSDSADISATVKPWSKIWSRKVSRRLFLNQSEVAFDGINGASLSVSVACFTEQTRLFWLLLRSKVCDFIILVEIKTRLPEVRLPVIGFYSQSWTPSATCTCSNGKLLPKPNSTSAGNCPFLTEVNIPTRNDALWNALWSMFLKTLQPHEKSFWNKHFEMDIGICLILWLLSPEEEEDVVDEFIQVLLTRVTYNLKVEPPKDIEIIIPRSIEILDVRKRSHITLPVHLSKLDPSSLLFKLIMTSENGKEIRNLAIKLTPFKEPEQDQDSFKSSQVQVVPSRFIGICKKQK